MPLGSEWSFDLSQIRLLTVFGVQIAAQVWAIRAVASMFIATRLRVRYVALVLEVTIFLR